MPEISNRTLVVAIQAVASEIRTLREALAGGDAEPEEFQILEELTQAADDLERAYEIAAQKVINLPPYDELAGR